VIGKNRFFLTQMSPLYVRRAGISQNDEGGRT